MMMMTINITSAGAVDREFVCIEGGPGGAQGGLKEAQGGARGTQGGPKGAQGAQGGLVEVFGGGLSGKSVVRAINFYIFGTHPRIPWIPWKRCQEPQIRPTQTTRRSLRMT